MKTSPVTWLDIEFSEFSNQFLFIISDNAGLFNIYIVITATVLVLMTLIILVIGRIVLMKRNASADTKLHECSVDLAISTKGLGESKGDDGTSLDSDLNSTDHATISNMPRDDV